MVDDADDPNDRASGPAREPLTRPDGFAERFRELGRLGGSGSRGR